jgi:hypothetical protein
VVLLLWLHNLATLSHLTGDSACRTIHLTLSSGLTPRFSTQYSQKLIRHILDFPVTAASLSARRART